jgi:parvulin-like peptidyl-prolyl isomerase
VRRLLVAFTVLLCGACSSSPSPSSTASPQVVARVGPTAIGSALFELRLRSALAAVAQAGGPSNNPAMTAQVRASVLRSLIIDTVIAQEATASGVAATDAEIQGQVDADASAAGGLTQLQSRLATLGGSMDQLRDEIRSSLNEQKLEDVFARLRAMEIEQKLTTGSAFATLAAQYSDDSSTATKGGEIGTVTRTQLQGDDPAYVTAVVALAAGHHTNPPIRDAQGYDIVELESSTTSTVTLRHIIVNAPQPYTVKERPRWFSLAIFETLAQDCSAGQIHVYIANVGDDPCAAVSPSASAPASSSAAPSLTPSP